MTAAQTPAEMLAEIDGRAEAATAGPWEFGRTPRTDRKAREQWLSETCSDGDAPLWATWRMGDRSAVDVVIPAVTGDGPRSHANAEFIAASRTDVPKMSKALKAVLALHEGWHVCVNADRRGATDYSDGIVDENDGAVACPTITAITEALGATA